MLVWIRMRAGVGGFIFCIVVQTNPPLYWYTPIVLKHLPTKSSTITQLTYIRVDCEEAILNGKGSCYRIQHNLAFSWTFYMYVPFKMSRLFNRFVNFIYQKSKVFLRFCRYTINFGFLCLSPFISKFHHNLFLNLDQENTLSELAPYLPEIRHSICWHRTAEYWSSRDQRLVAS